jgi:hypothetical protein
MTKNSRRTFLTAILAPAAMITLAGASAFMTSNDALASDESYRAGFKAGVIKGEVDGYDDGFKHMQDESRVLKLPDKFVVEEPYDEKLYSAGYRKGYMLSYDLAWYSGRRSGGFTGRVFTDDIEKDKSEIIWTCLKGGYCP